MRPGNWVSPTERTGSAPVLVLDDVLSELGYRDISGYNKAFAKGQIQPPLGTEIEYEHMPFIVVVVDELNDLMMVAARDVEESITRIAQKARAVGIHLIVATQRPSTDVITGVLKGNLPTRIAFQVASRSRSRSRSRPMRALESSRKSTRSGAARTPARSAS